MRAYVPSYELVSPSTLQEALGLLAELNGEWRPFAGGTDLMVLFEAGKLSHNKFVNILGLAELKGIRVLPSHVEIGALATYAQIQKNPVLAQEFPLLCRAARETGAIAIQSRGTLGGNIANASPAADSPPALLVYEAEVELVSQSGIRRVSYDQFHKGYKKTALAPGELIQTIRLRRGISSRTVHYYRKVGTRKAQAISKVCMAALAEWTQDGSRPIIRSARIALGSVAPTSVLCPKISEFLVGQSLDDQMIKDAQAEIQNEIAPIDDIRSNAQYRRQVTANLLGEFLREVKTNVELGR